MYGKYGYLERRIFPCTCVVNEKAGMNGEELHKYFTNTILLCIRMWKINHVKGMCCCLFMLLSPYRDTLASRIFYAVHDIVTAKVDGGPGRTNIGILAYLYTV